MTHDQPGSPGPQAWLPQDVPAPSAGPAQQPGYQQPGYQPPTAQPGYQQPGQMPYGPAYPSQAPYAQPTYYGPPAPQRTPTLAILGLVLAFLAPLVGLVLSIVALVRAKADGNGRGLAIAGLVVSIVATPILAAIAIPVFLNQRELAQAAGPREAFEEATLALAEGDCEGFMSGSTASFRAQLGTPTCDEFDAFVEMANSDPVGLGAVPVTDVVVDGDVATVSTLERVVWGDGEPPTTEAFEYRMVLRSGVWLMDGVALAD